MEDIIHKINTISIDDTLLDNNITMHEQTARPEWQDFNLPVAGFPVLPLEVVNYYCRTHFDDEDFIYVRFELPMAIQTIITESGFPDIIHFMQNDYEKNKESYDAHVRDSYEIIIKLFDKVIDWNMSIDAEMEPPEDLLSPNYVRDVYTLCNIIRSKYNLNMYDPLYKNITPYYREIYYGLGLIVCQLGMICDYYLNIRQITEVRHFSKRHQDRFMRLVNNLCIIMIHNNISWSHSDYFCDAEDPFTFEDPDSSWRLSMPKE